MPLLYIFQYYNVNVKKRVLKRYTILRHINIIVKIISLNTYRLPELHLLFKICTNQKMSLAGVKGSSVRMSMYVRVTECTVLVYLHNTSHCKTQKLLKGLRLLSAKPIATKILKYQDDIVKNQLLNLTLKIFNEQNWPFKLPG